MECDGAAARSIHGQIVTRGAIALGANLILFKPPSLILKSLIYGLIASP
jgi:hypothetical protein